MVRERDRPVCHIPGCKVVHQVEFAGGSSSHAHRDSTGEVPHRFYATRRLYQEALSIIVGSRNKRHSAGTIARAGPRRIANEDINVTGLQTSEAFQPRYGNVIDLARISEYRRGNCFAVVDIEAHPMALTIGLAEARQSTVDAALQEPTLLYCCQRAVLSCGSPGSHAKKERCCRRECDGPSHISSAC